MNILDDAPPDAATHAFAVELEIDDEKDGDLVRELWDAVPDKGDYGVSYAMVLCKDGRIGTAALRAALQRFNEPPEDGWRWTVDALAAHLLSDLCGITLAGWRYPPRVLHRGRPARSLPSRRRRFGGSPPLTRHSRTAEGSLEKRW